MPLGTGRRILNLQEAEKERTFIFSRLFKEEFPGARKRAKARRAALHPKAQGGKFRIESEEKFLLAREIPNRKRRKTQVLTRRLNNG